MSAHMSDIAAQKEQFFGVSPFNFVSVAMLYANCELHVIFMQKIVESDLWLRMY